MSLAQHRAEQLAAATGFAWSELTPASRARFLDLARSEAEMAELRPSSPRPAGLLARFRRWRRWRAVQHRRRALRGGYGGEFGAVSYFLSHDFARMRRRHWARRLAAERAGRPLPPERPEPSTVRL